MTIPRMSADDPALATQIASALDDAGCCVIEGAAPAETMDAMHPAVMAAGDHVLGHATTWRFSASEYIEIGPGETPQRLHRDAWKYDQVDFGPEVELNRIGYAKTGNGLGYWRDSEDPLSAVHPDRDFPRGWATIRSS